MFSDNYRFLGKCYRLGSDSKELQAAMRSVYAYFRLPGGKARGKFKKIYLPLNKKDKFFIRQKALAVSSLLASRTTSHYIFHGGVVSYKNKGILICAYSALGKTTLVLELLRRGFSLLSDELIPVSLSSQTIEPFPRSLHLSVNTLNLFPEISSIGWRRRAGRNSERKILLEIKDLPWGKIGKRCSPRFIVFLASPGGIKAKSKFIELAVESVRPGFLKALKRLKGVKEVDKLGGRRDFCLLRLEVTKGLKLLPAIRALCFSRQVPMIYAHRGRTEPINWQVSPRLRSLSASRGILRLSRMLLLSSKTALLKEKFSGSSGKLLTEIAKLSRETCFYQMVPGRLKEMGNLIENLIKK